MGIRITSLPEKFSMYDHDYFVLADPSAHATYKIKSKYVRIGFITGSVNTAVGTISPTFQLSLTDASGLPYPDPLGGPIIRTNAGGLEIRNSTNTAYWNIFVGGITSSGNVFPSTDVTYDIGSPSLRWKNVYALSGSFGYVSASTVNSTTGIFTNLTASNAYFLNPPAYSRIILAPERSGSPSLAFTISDDTGLYLNTSSLGGVALSTGATDAAVFSSASIQLNADITASGNLIVAREVLASSKSFLIPHPTKPAMKLQHGSLEGPEHAVFIRGELVDTSIIFLPEYWSKLVDANTITVQLTPVGKYQKLYVSSVSEKEIIIQNSSLMSKNVNCYYVVMATRKDIPSLKVEF